MNIPPLTFVILAAGIFATLAVLLFAFSGPSAGRAQARRLEGLKTRAGTGKGVTVEAQMRSISSNRDTRMDSFFKGVIPNREVLQKRLSRTGKGWTVGKYAITSLGLAVAIGALLYVKMQNPLLAIFGGLALGLLLPHVIVSSQIKKRTAKFNAKFPDAIELMVRGLRSGLPISETLGIVGTEIPDPAGSEFRGVSDRIKIGKTMDQALQTTADRIGTPEFQFFCITLAIQRETGGNLAETLMNLADVLRKRAQMKLKIKAMSSESKASAYIIGVLPFGVFGIIYTMNAKYIGVFFTDQRLIVAGIGGLIWMSIGAFVMAKMINFEI